MSPSATSNLDRAARQSAREGFAAGWREALESPVGASLMAQKSEPGADWMIGWGFGACLRRAEQPGGWMPALDDLATPALRCFQRALGGAFLCGARLALAGPSFAGSERAFGEHLWRLAPREALTVLLRDQIPACERLAEDLSGELWALAQERRLDEACDLARPSDPGSAPRL